MTTVNGTAKRWNGAGWEYVGQLPLAHQHALSDVATLAALPSRGMRRATAPIRFDPAFGRSQWPGTGGLSDGVATWGDYMSAHPILAGHKATAVYVAYVNASAHEDVAVPNNIVVRSGVQDQAGNVRPVFWILGGSGRTATIEPGGLLLGVATVSETVGVKVRSNVSVLNAGDKWPLSEASGGGTAAWVTEFSVTGTGANDDRSLAGAITGTNQFQFRPVYVGGDLDSIPSYVIAGIGDSMGTGTGDNVGPFPDAGKGFLRRAVNLQYGFINLSAGGETAQNWASDTYRQLRGLFLDGCSHAIDALGRNDLAASRTLAQVKADLISVWFYCNSKGIKVMRTTLPPDTTSADNFTTLGGQSTKAWELIRVALNDWVRGGSPIDPTSKAAVAVGTVGALVAGGAGHPLSGYFETADTVESARNSGLWKADGVTPNLYASDGVHPATAGHIAMAGAISIPTLVAA